MENLDSLRPEGRRSFMVMAGGSAAAPPARRIVLQPQETQNRRRDESIPGRAARPENSVYTKNLTRPNVCERALKRAVLHRKNALFYRTLHGAEVGDLFMSLIHTCQLCRANSFDYLTELQRHAPELPARPSEWMPWNYRDTLARSGV